MRHRASLLTPLFAACIAAACSSSDAPPSREQRDAAPAGFQTGCASSTQSCYCPDGTLSGTQACTGSQTLSTCTCLVSPGSAPTGTPGNTSRVCADLRGQRSCNATSYTSQQVPASILFVVDRSGSMACNLPGVESIADCNANPVRADSTQPSKWEVTVSALDAAFSGLSGTASAVGLSLFSSDGQCGVDAAPIVELARRAPSRPPRCPMRSPPRPLQAARPSSAPSSRPITISTRSCTPPATATSSS